MSTIRIITLAAIALAASGLLAGCGGEAERYGESLTTTEPTRVAALLDSPESHDGSDVRLEGVIRTECPSGCWFDLEDEGAVIRVDLAPHGIAIPQRVGDAVAVEGSIRLRDGVPSLIGRGVEFR